MPRCYAHDYHSRCIYHITITKAGGIPDLASLTGGVESAKSVPTSMGRIIVNALFDLPKREPALRLLQYVIMPDHIHFLLFVTVRTEMALGNYIGIMKAQVNREYELQTAIKTPVFNPDFYDRILFPGASLNVIYRYIRQNPYRLAVRLAHPDFFTRVSRIEIEGMVCQAYGNLQLLDNPFKSQVIVHRADTPEEFSNMKQIWVYTAANGGVLVSPFISKREKEVRNDAEALGGKFILLKEKPFREKEKPSDREFRLCALGKMLIISPEIALDFSRQTCQQLNSLATAICKTK